MEPMYCIVFNYIQLYSTVYCIQFLDIFLCHLKQSFLRHNTWICSAVDVAGQKIKLTNLVMEAKSNLGYAHGTPEKFFAGAKTIPNRASLVVNSISTTFCTCMQIFAQKIVFALLLRENDKKHSKSWSKSPEDRWRKAKFQPFQDRKRNRRMVGHLTMT